jgi:uracil-DNA glycosylase family 4
MENLHKLKEEYKRKYEDRKLVFGEGDENTKVLLVGEAPGGEEEKLGRPFVGKAGKNLDEFIVLAGLERKDLYITNVVKFRPTKLSPKTGRAVNRTPDKNEIEDFLPLLKEEIKSVNPQVVVTLGNVPLKAVTEDSKISIGDCHGKVIEKGGIKIFPLYHPASIIYNRSLADTYKEDVLKLKEYLNQK